MFRQFRRWIPWNIFSFAFSAILVSSLSVLGDSADESRTAAAPTVRLDFSLLDTRGQAHFLRPEPGCKALVFVFITTECPIARGYVPELNRQVASLTESNSGVRFFGVISDRNSKQQEAAEHVARFQFDFPVLFDSSGLLADVLMPTHTPEAFVVDAFGKVAYRGRIDDLYAGVGKKRSVATRRDLAEAVAELLSGKAPTRAYVAPVGCLFEGKKQLGKGGGGVTFTRDIAPILQANCVKCHRDGEVAPFPLISYTDAAKRAGQIVQVTASRVMPPWKPEPNFGHFLNERRLTDRELELLDDWEQAGAPEGDPADLPPPRRFAEGWQIGEPDLVIRMTEPFEIPADGGDIFRNFVVPSGADEDKLVEAVEFRPGNRRVVHHALFYLDTSGAARRKDAADPGPGYGSFGGPGFVPIGSIGGWAPGGTPQVLRDGIGRPLYKGCDIVMQIHYHPTGKAERDQSSVGIHFVKEDAVKSRKPAAAIMVIDRRLSIPAGDSDYRLSGSYMLPDAVTLINITPHMHLLGREMKATATLPDGTVQPLIWIKDWNFNWQDQYQFAEPVRLPKGTQLDVAARYDNSERNLLNPNTPPRVVTWGEQTTDEMFICFFLVSTDTPQQLRPLIVDNLRAMGPALQRKPAKPEPLATGE